MLEAVGVRRAEYVGRYDWITFAIEGVFRDGEIRELISDSYQNIRGKLPKSAAAKLEAIAPTRRAARRAR